MTTNKQSSIAVVGDANLTTLLRLAGVGSYYTIEDDDSVESGVRETLSELVNKPGVSIIAIQSDYAGYARDIIDRLANEKRLFPVVIEVPSGSSTGEEDAAEYYRSFVRKFVGFDIEI